MEEVYKNLCVGGDSDFEKIAHREGWSCLRCCKFGQSGHKDILGYTSQAAPKGPDYLWAKKGDNLLALNLLDLDDPHPVSTEMIKMGLDFIKNRLESGDKVLVACNAGKSRGPSMALLFLRSIGEMPNSFAWSERIFSTLYPEYNPKQGIRQKARQLWGELEPTNKENNGE